MRPIKQAVYSSRTADKFVVRLPDGMRELIAQVARTHHRSMNSEIIARLERSINEDAVLGDENQYVSDIQKVIERLDVQPWIPQLGQCVRRRDSKEMLGPIMSFKMSKMGLMANTELEDESGLRKSTQAVGLLEPVDIFEVIEASADPVHKALGRIGNC
jgi:hypothetical protein